jgi:hypothetical protein
MPLPRGERAVAHEHPCRPMAHWAYRQHAEGHDAVAAEPTPILAQAAFTRSYATGLARVGRARRTVEIIKHVALPRTPLSSVANPASGHSPISACLTHPANASPARQSMRTFLEAFPVTLTGAQDARSVVAVGSTAFRHVPSTPSD